MKYSLFLFIAFLFHFSAFGQAKKIQPLHQFMQANADSTLVLEFTSSWLHFPAYYLLSRKDNIISCYTYELTEKPGAFGPTPAKISEAMFKLQMKILSEPMDVNYYFRSYLGRLAERKEFWNQISSLQPWQLKDDAMEGDRCPAAPHTKAERGAPVVYDGAGIQLYLITKAEIKILDFDAPQFYEESCPGRPSRIAINKMATLFKAHFLPETTKR
ncbi:hypothetical protein H9X96_09410 [Pedobacter sp. N36a]|uniref:hypothetical protein n=1 Tax=Pedobacter sp. N36a TaxID=2767996 RepID=UPI001656D7C0|nr:hypothetical protein [Pedobacter sp. N36a]MBC8985995.1 hypothetical protein [Pedobacter sp. N36a]